MTSKTNKRPIINDIPVKELNAAKDTTPEVRVKVVRTTSSGQWLSVAPRLIKPISDLTNGRIEEWLQGYSGGGSYVLEVFDPSTDEPMCDRFRLTLPGAPRDPKLTPQAGASANGQARNRFGVQVPPSAYEVPGVATPNLDTRGQLNSPPQT